MKKYEKLGNDIKEYVVSKILGEIKDLEKTDNSKFLEELNRIIAEVMSAALGGVLEIQYATAKLLVGAEDE